jgi:hypothetical protein
MMPESSRQVSTIYSVSRCARCFQIVLMDFWRIFWIHLSAPSTNSGWSSSFQLPAASRSASRCSRRRISRSTKLMIKAARCLWPATLSTADASSRGMGTRVRGLRMLCISKTCANLPCNHNANHSGNHLLGRAGAIRSGGRHRRIAGNHATSRQQHSAEPIDGGVSIADAKTLGKNYKRTIFFETWPRSVLRVSTMSWAFRRTAW